MCGGGGKFVCLWFCFDSNGWSTLLPHNCATFPPSSPGLTVVGAGQSSQNVASAPLALLAAVLGL